MQAAPAFRRGIWEGRSWEKEGLGMVPVAHVDLQCEVVSCMVRCCSSCWEERATRARATVEGKPTGDLLWHVR